MTDTQDHAGEQVGSEVHWRIGFLEERYPGVHLGDIREWLGFLGQGCDLWQIIATIGYAIMRAIGCAVVFYEVAVGC